jgi:signal transduction histidine kinase/ActR/RegA family two-component response regulator
MASVSDTRTAFEAEVKERFGVLPNFFRSAQAAPDLIQQLWSFAKAGYLDNPMPALFKERLFVWLSRFCPVRYCIVRHVGFLLGHGRPAGDADAPTASVAEVIELLRCPTPWDRNMPAIFARLAASSELCTVWPEARTEMEELLFACATILFVEPTRGEQARDALLSALGPSRFEFLAGFLAFVRAAHYWTILHPEIETEDDMRGLMRDHEELCGLLLDDPEADRCEMSQRLFEELTTLRELNERQELEKAKRALEERDRQKDQFIAVLAHELRNPLAAIRAATDLLDLRGLADSKAQHLVKLLDRQSATMARMLDDLLDASRIALGKVSLQIEDINLLKLLGDTRGDYESRVRQADLRLQFEGPDAPCFVNGDRIRLRQIIDNLLSNAIKFTSAPGRITIRIRPEAARVYLEVEDTGIGFDAAASTRLFEAFFQQEQTVGRSGGGLGLGLAISSKLAELQGGQLSASSPGAGHGSVFTLMMPVIEPPAHVTIPGERPRAAKCLRVLLVEDNKDVADCLAQMIDLAGFEANVVYDGSSALALATSEVPEIIVCDIGLPGEVDGYNVARACRREPALQKIRLIATSGYSRPEDHAKAKEAGFDRLLPKPVTFDILDAALREMALVSEPDFLMS